MLAQRNLHRVAAENAVVGAEDGQRRIAVFKPFGVSFADNGDIFGDAESGFREERNRGECAGGGLEDESRNLFFANHIQVLFRYFPGGVD